MKQSKTVITTQMNLSGPRQFQRWVNDLAEILWDSLTERPCFQSLNVEAFAPLRGAVEEVLRQSTFNGRLEIGAEHPELISNLVDRINLIVEVMGTGRLPYGPMQALVEEALELVFERTLTQSDRRIA